jgi:hypothetical protein
VAEPDLPLLRHTLDRLDALPAAAAVAQESLDFLATVAGLKPVCLLGRGFGDAARVAAMCKLARDIGLRVVDGPYWNTAPPGQDFPTWYADHCRDELAGLTARYICAGPAVAAEVRRACDAGGPAVADEARLLGYPECCVAAHYRRTWAFHRATLAMLRRTAAGDEGGMHRLLAAAAPLYPETAAERAGLDAAITPCPFTSFNMCVACCADGGGPAAAISLEYARLAHRIDTAFARRLAAAG